MAKFPMTTIWFNTFTEGHGLCVLYEPAATWLKLALDENHVQYAVRIEPATNLAVKMLTMQPMPKRTRDAHASDDMHVFKLPFTQDDCDQIMTQLTLMPVHIEYAHWLADGNIPDAWHALSDAFANAPETTDDSLFVVPGFGFAPLMRRIGADAAGIQLTEPDDRVDAESVVLENVSRQYRGIYRAEPLYAARIRKSQNVCDAATQACICDPFMPEAICDYAPTIKLEPVDPDDPEALLEHRPVEWNALESGLPDTIDLAAAEAELDQMLAAVRS